MTELEGNFNNDATVIVHDSAEDLASAAVGDFVRRAEEAIGERGRFVVALAGGSTPIATYELLAKDARDSVDWSKVHVFFGDERTVPPDSEDSNFKMADDALLSHVSPASVHRMRGELDPARAAEEYERELSEFFGGERPVFDLIHLGIGDDGHTASLFPNTDALDVSDRIAVENRVEKLDTMRLTLTKETINAARAVVFLVAGEGKAGALEKILKSNADPHEFPSKLIRPAGGPVWMLDRAAASKLEAG